MLKFFKGLFGKKEEGFNYFSPPAGTKIHDLNLGGAIVTAKEKGHDALRLQGVELSEKGVSKFKSLEGLRALDLSNSTIDDTAMSALKGCTKLEHLNLSGTQITGACFVKIGALPNLLSLDLSKTNVVDMTILALRSAPKLRALDLSGTKLTDQCIDYIGQLKSLRVLKVKDMNIDGAGLAMLTHGNEELQIDD